MSLGRVFLEWVSVWILGLNQSRSDRVLLGVGGFSLGGGYSWKTNQVGLTVDTIVSFDLVLPSGAITKVTNSSNPDLFFALKVNKIALARGLGLTLLCTLFNRVE